MSFRTVVKKEDAIKRKFKDINFDSLAAAERSIVTKINYIERNFAYDINIRQSKQKMYIR